MIYLDNSATSFLKPKEVKDEVLKALDEYTGNSSRGGHKIANRCSEKVYETREKLAKFFGISNPLDVIFTKNASESLNLAIQGSLKKGGHIITTCFEHNSVLRVLKFFEKQKLIEVTVIYPKGYCVTKEEIESHIRPNTYMVITTHVSNVTGAMCDIYKIGEMCKSKNLLYLVDASQSVGHCKINLKDSGISLFAFSGHKGMLAITGVGVLIVNEKIKLKNILFGGTGTNSFDLIQPIDYPDGFEVGTLPIIPIISLGAGVDYLSKNLNRIIKKEQQLTSYMIKKLKEVKMMEYFFDENNCNGVFSFNKIGFNSSEVEMILAENDICVRAGLHCSPLSHSFLGTIKTGTVRASINFNNTFEDIDKFIEVLKTI